MTSDLVSVCPCVQVCVRACGLVDVSCWFLGAVLVFGVLAAAVWYVPFKLLPTWNCIIMRDQEVIEQPMTLETLPQRLLGEAQDFIRRSDGVHRRASSLKTYRNVLTLNAGTTLRPYESNLTSELDVSRNADRPFMLFFSLVHIHTPLFKTPAFAGKSQHGRYGDNMEELDWMVGA